MDYDLIMLTLSEELKWRKSPTSNKLKYMKNSYAWLNQVDFGEKQTKEQVLDIKIV